MFYTGDIELVCLYLPLHDEANARIEGTVKKRLHEVFLFFFIALNITDLKLYFFLGETMKHEKERERER